MAKSQSGQFRGKETLSKRGNKRLRMIFWLAGLRAVHLPGWRRLCRGQEWNRLSAVF
ncbi:MAG: IS110 family transposase [Acidobacteriota bacterium]|nr:IS110 family transposase [Acidobacteriota bacterium]